MKITQKLDLGKVAYTSKQKRNRVELELRVTAKTPVAPQLTIDLLPAPRLVEVTISGTIWNATGTDHASGGQNEDQILRFFPRGNPARIVQLWKRWHLGGMKAGTRAQQAFIDGYQLARPDWHYEYGEACTLLEQGGLLVDRGYKYGHHWLCEHVDPAALVELYQLFGHKSTKGDLLLELATELHNLMQELTHGIPAEVQEASGEALASSS